MEGRAVIKDREDSVKTPSKVPVRGTRAGETTPEGEAHEGGGRSREGGPGGGSYRREILPPRHPTAI